VSSSSISVPPHCCGVPLALPSKKTVLALFCADMDGGFDHIKSVIDFAFLSAIEAYINALLSTRVVVTLIGAGTISAQIDAKAVGALFSARDFCALFFDPLFQRGLRRKYLVQSVVNSLF
jgi:hypothetical protein